MLARTFTLALAVLTTLNVAAQQPAASDHYEHQQQYAVVQDGQALVLTYWGSGGSGLPAYVKNHSGTYIVFVRDGLFFRLTDTVQIAELQKLAEPLPGLARQQEKLAAQQEPLAARQEELSRQMQSAVGTEAIVRVAEQQGRLGQQQGTLGQEQGRIGGIQGSVSQAVHRAVIKDIDDCVTRKTCTPAT